MISVVVSGSQSFFSLESLRDTTLWVWEKLKEYWTAFVDWVSATSVAFWFFRGVEAMYPSLSAKLESGYLYVTHFFRDLLAQQREAHLQRELHRLTTVIVEQQELVRRLGQEKEEGERAYQEFRGSAQAHLDFLKTRLRHSDHDVHTQDKEIQALRIICQEDSFLKRQLERERAVNQALRNQNAALIAERDMTLIKTITVVR